MIAWYFVSSDQQTCQGSWNEKQQWETKTEQNPPPLHSSKSLEGMRKWVEQQTYLRQCTSCMFCRRGSSNDTEVSRLQLTSSKTCNKVKMSDLTSNSSYLGRMRTWEDIWARKICRAGDFKPPTCNYEILQPWKLMQFPHSYEAWGLSTLAILQTSKQTRKHVKWMIDLHNAKIKMVMSHQKENWPQVICLDNMKHQEYED